MIDKNKTLRKTGSILSTVSIILFLIERLSSSISDGLGKIICGSNFMQPVHGAVGDSSCGFNMDMYLTVCLLLIFAAGILLIIASSKNKNLPVLLLLAVVPTYTPDALADTAVFAGGCFWCMEAYFEKLEGVTDVISGFTGGTLKNPTYNGNHSGHVEAVEITYDPNKVSYSSLLEYYWIHIDPFDAKGQFCDKGSSYLSAVFVAGETERALAEESKKRVAAQFPNQKIITPILPRSTFYPMKGDESYHQDYYKNNPVRYKFYRWNCGRDQRLKKIWGDKVTH